MQRVIITKGKYYGKEVTAAGEIQKIEMEGGEMHLLLKLTGTPSEDLLRAHTADPTGFRVHRCPADCSQVESGENYLHGMTARLVTKDEDETPWSKNLVGIGAIPPEEGRDELAGLRRRQEALGDVPVPEKEESDHGKDKKKDKKEKKRKKREKSKEKETKLDGSQPLRASIKAAEDLFGGTGLDPEARVRRRTLRKARRHLQDKDKKKKDASSTSGSSSGSGSAGSGKALEGLFSETSRARSISDRYPGVLCAEALKTMQETLLLEMGEETEDSPIRPICLMYYRQYLSRKASGPMSRELLNISTALDALVRNRPALCADILAQRLKATEACLLGIHWSVAQRMEVPMSEGQSLAGRVELDRAQRETAQEQKTKKMAAAPSGWRGEEPRGGKQGQKGGKDKGKDDRRDRDRRDGKGGKNAPKGEEKK